jgi:hypothetical protein
MKIVWTEDYIATAGTPAIPTRFRIVQTARAGGAYALEREVMSALDEPGWLTVLAFATGDVDLKTLPNAGFTPTMLVGLLDIVNGNRTR